VNQLRQQNLRGKVVALLGMAFKSESDDKRESLSYKLRKLLMVEAKQVLCTDPYVVDDKLVSLEAALELSDIVILGAPHSVYRDLKFSPNQVCVDVWGFWPNQRHLAQESASSELSLTGAS
jgi:UDP-N-acetyl-D-mannosaminuronic acid dehydrogenase